MPAALLTPHTPVPLSVRGTHLHPQPTTPAPPTPTHTDRLIDSHGRTIRHLRLSITDRCNFRCRYCMEPDVRFLPPSELLSVAELLRLARVCVALGVTKVRLTGGEPTLHPRLTSIIRGVAALTPGAVAMTSNGALLTPAALAEWVAAGLSHLTISLDTLSPHRFAVLTRSRATPDTVVQGIRAALAAGLASVKLNAVIIRGTNEADIPALAGLAHDLGLELRFIEYMPLDSGRHWDPSLLVPADETLAAVERIHPLRPLARDDPSSTAERYAFADGAPGGIGVIAPVTRPFCGACSRLRITADGKIRPCLFSLHETDLRPLLRSPPGPAADHALAAALIHATWHKQAGHGITAPGFQQPSRPMSAIGG